MTIKELKQVFESKGISENMYSLKGGLPNEIYCIEKIDDVWEVYYSERGSKTGLKVFITEDEACQYLLKQVARMLEI